MKATSSQTCKCGHGRDMHEHFRAGSDCGECSSAGCGKFRRGHAHQRSIFPQRSVAKVTHLIRATSREDRDRESVPNAR